MESFQNYPFINLSKGIQNLRINEFCAIFPATWQNGENQCLLQTFVFQENRNYWIDFGIEENIICLAIGEEFHGTPICFATQNKLFFCGDIQSILNSGENEDIVHASENLTLLCTQEGTIRNICFEEETGKLIAVCVDAQIQVFELETFNQIIQLQGHTVTSCAFFPKRSHLLVSISQDRTFKVWHLEQNSILYQSSIVSSSPFISITMDLELSRFAIGSLDGKVRFYEMKSERECTLLHVTDISVFVKSQNSKKTTTLAQKVEKAVINSIPAWKQLVNDINQELTKEEIHSSKLETIPILELYFLKGTSNTKESETGLTILPHGEGHHNILVGTPEAIYKINTSNYEISSIANLKYPSDELVAKTGGNLVSSAACFSFCHANEETVICSFCGETEAIINFLFLPLSGEDRIENKDPLSVFPTKLPSSRSYLAQEIVIKQSKPVKKTKSKATNSNTRLPPVKVKSSGYGSTPPVMKMFSGNGKPRVSLPVKYSKANPFVNLPKPEQKQSKEIPEYPINCGLTQYFQPKHSLKDKIHNGPILRLFYNGDGTRLFTCSSDKTARMMKLPLSKYQGDGISYIGHNAGVNYVACSNQKSLVLTGSEDGSVRMWDVKSAEQMMLIDREHNFKMKDESSPKPFGIPVKQVSFFYVDKFILFSAKNSLYLYKYLIIDDEERTKLSDLQKLQITHKYKLNVKIESVSQQITSFGCINGFLSNIVIVAGSNKSLEVVEMSTGKIVRTLQEVHAKPVHSIFMNESSPYVQHSQESYNLFLTAAADNTIKLWDLRTEKVARLFQGHTNRVQQVGISLSPCLRYIASGSEDKSAYIFDIRTGSYLKKLQGHSDTVSDVAYHPTKPQIATCSFDGTVRFYNETE